ncbi:DUF2797 domain-containing protein [Streptomyces sp. NPDC001941]|uniref:DUF2797 domain-containing protein n=1 Tax=Streptomyces sp. NPDC001941 TaxID=3154659 RepID=UPI0033195071
MGWVCRGLGWAEGVPGLGWRGGRVSPLAYGREIGFRAVGERRCLGARGHDCPSAARTPGRSTGGQCPECARLDRAHSIAADTVADDPRVFRVYLAWFGPGLLKVGITAEERGGTRLLEQGAVAYAWLGRGPLMAARRTEELLKAALGVPDRVPYARKRTVRAELPGPGEREAELAALHARALSLPGWAESLEPLGFAPVDQVAAFGLEAAEPVAAVVTELVADGTVGGRLVAAAGPDLHLWTAERGVVVLDTRLVRGWELAAADPGAPVTVPVRPIDPGVQEGLF